MDNQDTTKWNHRDIMAFSETGKVLLFANKNLKVLCSPVSISSRMRAIYIYLTLTLVGMTYEVMFWTTR